MKKLVVANWKMNPPSWKEAVKLFLEINRGLRGLKKTEVVICPPFVYIPYLQKAKSYKPKASLGAQNVFGAEAGAYTGEISAEMLASSKVSYVILGHSERRALGETDEVINKKVKASLAAGLRPIICVGERERDSAHGYFEVVKSQITAALRGVSKNFTPKIELAYEPVWAISTTKNRRDATAADAYEMVMFIRKTLSDLFTPAQAAKIRILYGGSVTDKDAGEFLEQGGAAGVLVGAASLSPEKFGRIIKIAEKCA